MSGATGQWWPRATPGQDGKHGNTSLPTVCVFRRNPRDSADKDSRRCECVSLRLISATIACVFIVRVPQCRGAGRFAIHPRLLTQWWTQLGMCCACCGVAHSTAILGHNRRGVQPQFAGLALFNLCNYLPMSLHTTPNTSLCACIHLMASNIRHTTVYFVSHAYDLVNGHLAHTDVPISPLAQDVGTANAALAQRFFRNWQSSRYPLGQHITSKLTLADFRLVSFADVMGTLRVCAHTGTFVPTSCTTRISIIAHALGVGAGQGQQAPW